MAEPDMPKRRRRRLWDRKAVLFRRVALGCYAAAVVLAVLALAWSRLAWVVAGAVLLAGLWCERTAAFARRFAERNEDEVKADVPGD